MWSSFCLKSSRYARTGSHKAREEGIALEERGLWDISNYLQAASRYRNSDSPDVTQKEYFFIPEYTYRNSPIDIVKLKQNNHERIVKTFLTPYLADSPLPTQIHAVTWATRVPDVLPWLWQMIWTHRWNMNGSNFISESTVKNRDSC